MPKRAIKKSKAHSAGSNNTKNSDISTYVDYDMETFQQQALEIRQPGEHFDPTIEPQTGEEYLMKMLYERKQCPAVVVKRPKKLKTKVPSVMNSLKKNEEPKLNTNSSSKLLPTPEWKTVQAADFLATRNKINHMRQELKEQNYSNELEPPLTKEPAEWQQFCQQNPPLLSTILRINQRSLEQLLDMICEWLREGAEPRSGEEEEMEIEVTTQEVDTNEISQEETATGSLTATAVSESVEDGASAIHFDLSTKQQWLGSWLYATLACLHLPLEPDTHSSLRDIARICVRLRSSLKEHQLSNAVPYNLFICIISQVFDQFDLAEFV